MAAGVSAFLLTVPVWGHSTCCLVKRCHFHFWNKIFLTLEDKSLERFWTIVLLISTTIAGVLCAQCEGHAAPPLPLLLWSCPTGNQEINGTEVAQWIWMWCGMKLVSAASVLSICSWDLQNRKVVGIMRCRVFMLVFLTSSSFQEKSVTPS